MYENPVNTGHLVGRIGWDIKLDKVGTLDKTTLRMGVRRAYKDKVTGKYETDWINVVALGESAVTVKNLLNKGDLVAVTYSIRVSQYKSKEGKDRESVEHQLVSFSKLASGTAGAAIAAAAAPSGLADGVKMTSESLPPAPPAPVSSAPEQEIPF